MMREQVIEFLKDVKVGELIEVIWLDSVLTEKAPIKRLTNYHMTHYEKTPGYYVGVFKEKRYSEPMLVIARGEILEEKDPRPDIQSWPLGVVMKVQYPTSAQGHDADLKKKPLISIQTRKFKRAERIELLADGSRKILLARGVRHEH